MNKGYEYHEHVTRQGNELEGNYMRLEVQGQLLTEQNKNVGITIKDFFL
jgi:hypothetical protein